MFMNVVRIAKVVALLAFVLPWVAVSCQGVDLATASGIELIQGKMTSNPEATQQLGQRFGGGLDGASIKTSDPTDSPDLGMNYFALAAGIVIAAGFALSFIGPAKTAARNAVVTSLLAAGLCFGAVWQFREAVKSEGAQGQSASTSDNPFSSGDLGAMGNDMINNMLQERYGYWIVLGALIVAASAGGIGMAGGTTTPSRPETAA